MSNTRTNNKPLAQNTRFDCLNTDSTQTSSSYTRDRNTYTGDRNTYTGDNARYGNSMLRGRYSFLAEKREPRKRNRVNLKNERFPSLIDLKKNRENGNEIVMGNYKEKALYTQEEIQKIKKEKELQQERQSLKGWCTLTSNNGITKVCDIDERGRKIPITQWNDNNYDHNPEDKCYDHEKYQKECAVAMYKTLKTMQDVRDEENEILGPHSRYYNKGSLTDLSYISDDDVVSSDDNNDMRSDHDYDSDIDTY
jgi:hypothetical protein